MRARAAQAELLRHARDLARAHVFDDPGRHRVMLVVGLIAMLPFLALEAIGFVMLARTLP